MADTDMPVTWWRVAAVAAAVLAGVVATGAVFPESTREAFCRVLGDTNGDEWLSEKEAATPVLFGSLTREPTPTDVVLT